jgi:hypothetical protein
MKQKWPEFISKRIRRVIPPPVQLRDRIMDVYNLFKDKVDSSGQSLFNKANEKIMRNLLFHVDKGCYSDPPGSLELLYEKIGIDKGGFTLWRSLRGTNCVESLHQKIISCFSSSDASPSLADSLLAVLRHRVNSRAAVRWKGEYNCGHFEQHLVELIQDAGLELFGEVLHPTFSSTRDRIHVQESFGIINIGERHASIVELLPSFEEVDIRNKELLSLRSKIGIPIPFLPMHTSEEHELFRSCMLDKKSLHEIIDEFAKKSDGQRIFPKVIGHLEKYEKDYLKYGANYNLYSTTKLQMSKLKESWEPDLSSDEDEEEDLKETEEETVSPAQHHPVAPSNSDILMNGVEGVEIVPEISEHSDVEMGDPIDSDDHKISRADLETQGSNVTPQQDLDTASGAAGMLNHQQDLDASDQKVGVQNRRRTFTPSFTLDSEPISAPSELEQPVVQAKNKRKASNKRRCMNPHPRDPKRVCGRDTCPGSGGRKHCVTQIDDFQFRANVPRPHL